MSRFNTERVLGVAVALFVLAVAASVVVGSLALKKAVDVQQALTNPTVQQSQSRIGKSIGRYTDAQLLELLGRLLTVASPKQKHQVHRVRAVLRRRAQARARARVRPPEPRRGGSPRPRPSPAPGRPEPSVTPRPSPSPRPSPVPTRPPVVGAEVPGVPVHVCTRLVAVNC